MRKHRTPPLPAWLVIQADPKDAQNSAAAATHNEKARQSLPQVYAGASIGPDSMSIALATENGCPLLLLLSGLGRVPSHGRSAVQPHRKHLSRERLLFLSRGHEGAHRHRTQRHVGDSIAGALLHAPRRHRGAAEPRAGGQAGLAESKKRRCSLVPLP